MQYPYKIQLIESNGRQHLIIERFDGKPVQCGWDTLQKIKNRIVGEDVNMVEYFPATDCLVNEINRRHFWSTEENPPLST